MGATMTTFDPPAPIPTGIAGGATIDESEARLVEGAEGLARARSSLLSDPRLLVIVAATLMTLGVTAIIVGWIGAAHSTLVEEQVPYLISGGLLGVALSTIGALLYFTHWLTVSIKEARHHEAARRQDHDQLIEVLRGLDRPAPTTPPVLGGEIDGSARSAKPGRPVRRAPRST
jgi:hypothetical protein